MTTYDEWKLASPDEDASEIGTEEGDIRGRCPEPDEDAPRGYRPRPCNGLMSDDDGTFICDTCGEIA